MHLRVRYQGVNTFTYRKLSSRCAARNPGVAEVAGTVVEDAESLVIGGVRWIVVGGGAHIVGGGAHIVSDSGAHDEEKEDRPAPTPQRSTSSSVPYA